MYLIYLPNPHLELFISRLNGKAILWGVFILTSALIPAKLYPWSWEHVQYSSILVLFLSSLKLANLSDGAPWHIVSSQITPIPVPITCKYLQFWYGNMWNRTIPIPIQGMPSKCFLHKFCSKPSFPQKHSQRTSCSRIPLFVSLAIVSCWSIYSVLSYDDLHTAEFQWQPPTTALVLLQYQYKLVMSPRLGVWRRGLQTCGIYCKAQCISTAQPSLNSDM